MKTLDHWFNEEILLSDEKALTKKSVDALFSLISLCEKDKKSEWCTIVIKNEEAKLKKKPGEKDKLIVKEAIPYPFSIHVEYAYSKSFQWKLDELKNKTDFNLKNIFSYQTSADEAFLLEQCKLAFFVDAIKTAATDYLNAQQGSSKETDSAAVLTKVIAITRRLLAFSARDYIPYKFDDNLANALEKLITLSNIKEEEEKEESNNIEKIITEMLENERKLSTLREETVEKEQKIMPTLRMQMDKPKEESKFSNPYYASPLKNIFETYNLAIINLVYEAVKLFQESGRHRLSFLEKIFTYYGALKSEKVKTSTLPYVIQLYCEIVKSGTSILNKCREKIEINNSNIQKYPNKPNKQKPFADANEILTKKYGNVLNAVNLLADVAMIAATLFNQGNNDHAYLFIEVMQLLATYIMEQVAIIEGKGFFNKKITFTPKKQSPEYTTLYNAITNEITVEEGGISITPVSPEATKKLLGNITDGSKSDIKADTQSSITKFKDKENERKKNDKEKSEYKITLQLSAMKKDLLEAKRLAESAELSAEYEMTFAKRNSETLTLFNEAKQLFNTASVNYSKTGTESKEIVETLLETEKTIKEAKRKIEQADTEAPKRASNKLIGFFNSVTELTSEVRKQSKECENCITDHKVYSDGIISVEKLETNMETMNKAFEDAKTKFSELEKPVKPSISESKDSIPSKIYNYYVAAEVAFNDLKGDISRTNPEARKTIQQINDKLNIEKKAIEQLKKQATDLQNTTTDILTHNETGKLEELKQSVAANIDDIKKIKQEDLQYSKNFLTACKEVAAIYSDIASNLAKHAEEIVADLDKETNSKWEDLAQKEFNPIDKLKLAKSFLICAKGIYALFTEGDEFIEAAKTANEKIQPAEIAINNAGKDIPEKLSDKAIALAQNAEKDCTIVIEHAEKVQQLAKDRLIYETKEDLDTKATLTTAQDSINQAQETFKKGIAPLNANGSEWQSKFDEAFAALTNAEEELKKAQQAQEAAVKAIKEAETAEEVALTAISEFDLLAKSHLNMIKTDAEDEKINNTYKINIFKSLIGRFMEAETITKDFENSKRVVDNMAKAKETFNEVVAARETYTKNLTTKAIELTTKLENYASLAEQQRKLELDEFDEWVAKFKLCKTYADAAVAKAMQCLDQEDAQLSYQNMEAAKKTISEANNALLLVENVLAERLQRKKLVDKEEKGLRAKLEKKYLIHVRDRLDELENVRKLANEGSQTYTLEQRKGHLNDICLLHDVVKTLNQYKMYTLTPENELTNENIDSAQQNAINFGNALFSELNELLSNEEWSSEDVILVQTIINQIDQKQLARGRNPFMGDSPRKIKETPKKEHRGQRSNTTSDLLFTFGDQNEKIKQDEKMQDELQQAEKKEGEEEGKTTPRAKYRKMGFKVTKKPPQLELRSDSPITTSSQPPTLQQSPPPSEAPLEGKEQSYQ